MPRVRHLTTLALLPLAGCQLFALAAIGSSFPPQDGALTVDGLDGVVKVVRDDFAVPHVQASTEHDAWFGLGFVHGQDRFFQADLLRRLAYGRTAEWLGEDAADLDVFMRGLGVAERAQARYEALDAPAKAMLDAYTDGMNAGLASLPALPIEHRLLGVDADPWTPADCYASLFLQSWNLAENPDSEIAAWSLRKEADADLLQRLFTFTPESHPIDAWWDDVRGSLTGPYTDAFKAFTSTLGGRPDSAMASNNWVVGPERTTTGAPILANDPHLTQSVPSLWYVADIQGGDLHVAGATLAGTPGVIIGHNETFAWGLTNVMADVVDVAVLGREGEDGYVLSGEVKTFERLTVEIPVSGGRVVERTLLRTDVGPVITDLEGTHVLALRWHALELEDRLPEVLRGLNLSATVDEALTFTRLPMMVAQNVAMADSGGNWGMQSAGSVPQRVGFTGRVPYPASSTEVGWDGWFEALPGELRPERGYVHTANSRPDRYLPALEDVPPIEVDGITSSWVPDDRYRRIQELLDADSSVSPDEVAQQQLDVLDVRARELVPALLAASYPSGVSARCFRALAAWDFRWDADSTGAAVWAVMQRHLIREALSKQLSSDAIDLYLEATSNSRTLLQADLTSFLDQPARQVDAALQRACVELQTTLGPDVSGWTWGALHPLTLTHPFRSFSGLLGGWRLPEVPFGGSGTTVAAAGYAFRPGISPVTGMASLRIVVPLDDVGAAWLTYPGGQSGHPTHPDTQTHFDAFVDGDVVPLRFDEADIDAHASAVLELTP